MKRYWRLYHPGDVQQAVHELHALDIVTAHILRLEPEPRSTRANRYLWGVLYAAVRDHVLDTTGNMYTTDEVHEFFKARLLPPSVVQIGSEQRIVPGSTRRLTSEEFADYCEKITAYLIDDLGGTLPSQPGMDEW